MPSWRKRLLRTLSSPLERAVVRARAAILAERLWLALWPPLMVAGLFVLLLLLGVPALLPGWLRIGLSAMAAGGFVLLLWRGLKGLRLPCRHEALRRVERASALAHHPLLAMEDNLAPGLEADARTRALWHAHKARLRRALARPLRTGVPRSPLPRRDPFALRNALALALLATIALSTPGTLSQNLRLALTPGPAADAANTGLDAWLAPPAYTGQPPVVLASGGSLARREGEIIVPRGSKLTLRLAADGTPRLELHALMPSGRAGKLLSTVPLAANEGEEGFHLEQVITRPVVAVVRAGGELARWPISVIPDTPPRPSLEQPPQATPAGGLKLRWKVEDDYGATALKARFALATKPAARAGRRPKAADAPLSFATPDFSIPLPATQKTVSGTTTHDMAAHPWAGMEVVMHLEATDQAGQTGRSAPLRFILPARVFRKLAARAIIEQRRELILHPSRAPRIAATLAAFIAWPQGVAETSGIYLGLRHAAWRLHEARDEKDLKQIVALLWELAVKIEDGDLSEAMKRLQAAKKALEEALARGAGEKEIARLTEQLRKAMNDYLRSLASRARKGGESASRPPASARELSPGELNRMLDRIEDLARTGARNAARQMLSELDEMLRNLQPDAAPQGPPSPSERALGELQKLMHEQQKLMDETWRARPGAPRRQEQQGRAGRGQPRPKGQEQQGRQERGGRMQDLARRQRQLEQRLGEILDNLQNHGATAPKGLKDSRRAMNGAAGALGGGRRGKALEKQAEALRALRKGAGRLARQIARQRGQGRAGRFGSNRDGTDPLGRPLRDYGESRGPDRDMLPDESAVERARRILDALRERAARPDRPKRERDYIDRLLDGLY